MKAQFWSFDIIFAMILFSITMVILVAVWSSINGQLSLASNAGVQDMQLQTLSLASRLLTAGSPANWEGQVSASNASSWTGIGAGLAQGGSVLSPEKIATLESMSNHNYQATKALLGIGFDYFILIKGNNTDISMGLSPTANGATSVQSASESAVLNGEPVQVVVEVWTNSTISGG